MNNDNTEKTKKHPVVDSLEETLRAFRPARAKSAGKVVAALLELLHTKPYGSITVTEICETASIARKTFYRCFDSKDSVIIFRLDFMFAALCDKYEFEDGQTAAAIGYCFDYLNKDRELAAVFVNDELESLIISRVSEYVECVYGKTLYDAASFEPAFSEYYYRFIAVGLLSIVKTWLKGGAKQPIKSMVSLTRKLLSGVLS